MRYQVQGKDRRSGKPVELTLAAATPGDAAFDAAALGVQVESITAASDDAPSPAPPPAPAAQPIPLRRDPEETVLIEQTSKRIKLGLLIFWLVLLVALGLLFAGLWVAFTEQRFDRLGGGLMLASGAVFALGFAGLLFFRFQQWWRHG